MKNTRVSSIVCFTILVLPVLLDEEYWSFQYRVFYNTSITSIVGYCIVYRSTILVFQYCKCTILVHPVLYMYNTGISSIVNITILVIPVSRPAASYYLKFLTWNITLSASILMDSSWYKEFNEIVINVKQIKTIRFNLSRVCIK